MGSPAAGKHALGFVLLGNGRHFCRDRVRALDYDSALACNRRADRSSLISRRLGCELSLDFRRDCRRIFGPVRRVVDGAAVGSEKRKLVSDLSARGVPN